MRLAVRFRVPAAIGPDTFLHLHMARAIRANGHRIPEVVDRVTHSTAFTYPFLYHWLLSWAPAGKLRAAEMLTGPLCDGLQAVATGLFAYAVLHHLGVPSPLLWQGALSAALLIALCPAMLVASGGPRAYIGSPRPIGQLFYMLHLNGALLWGLTGEPLYLVPVVAGAVLVSVSSKFGNQALVFIAIVAGLLGAIWVPLAAIVGGAAALLVWRRRLLRVLRGHLGHSTFYCRHLAAPYLHRAYATVPPYPRRALSALLYLRSHPHLSLDWLFADENLLHRMIVQFPAGAAAICLYVWVLASTGAAWTWSLWPIVAAILASIAASIATSTRRLRFLGEPYRYIEHTASTQAILFVAILVPLFPEWLDAALVAMCFLGLLALWSAAKRMAWQYAPLNATWDGLAEALAPIDRDTTVIHPVSGWFWPVLAQTRHASIAFYGVNCDIDRFGIAAWNALYGNFPRPGVSFEALARDYGVTHVIGRPRDFDSYASETGDRSFVDGSRTPLFDRGDIRLFGCASPAGNATP